MYSLLDFYTNDTHHLIPGFLTCSPSKPEFHVQVDEIARTHNLPSSTSWDACYIKRASVDELQSWLPDSVNDLHSWLPDDTGSANAITPIYQVTREEDPAARAETRKLILRQARGTLCEVSQSQQRRLNAINRELHHLNRKRSKAENILQYEVLNRLLKVVDRGMKAQYLTNQEYDTLKAANFLWFGNFVDLNSRFVNISPNVRAIVTQVLSKVGNSVIDQFRLCRFLMFRAGQQGRHEQQHPKPSLEYAKAVISKMALTNPELDADWWHAIIDRSGSFSAEDWGDLEDIDAELELLQLEKSELEEGLKSMNCRLH
ncbi:hypothetical protein GGX14DRAFT_567312 [Mycena pura]|uniref:Uncharacterized protein n=1 Tax=Mycena pura TaxID=153505 RepID=A0AAD6YDX7_9AGAR|nr:hypothetical protein GGX14DRAFT_567311 [Mycena pura]KAJ7208013.1 hypothetical protein GGX14DRAFT_567312 [Mycena pura]